MQQAPGEGFAVAVQLVPGDGEVALGHGVRTSFRQ